MLGRLAKLFHIQTAELLKELNIPTDPNNWPSEWLDVEFKEYERMPSIGLHQPSEITQSLSTILRKRKSSQLFSSTPLRFDELSTLLYLSAGIREKLGETNLRSRRFYPSGGARYPLEIYLLLTGIQEVPDGVHHYNVKKHTLEQIGGKEIVAEAVSTLPVWAKSAPIILVFTSVWDRSYIKYQDFGYRLALIETGNLSQNIQLVATALQLQSCPVASFRLTEISKALDLDPLEEAPVLTLVLGK